MKLKSKRIMFILLFAVLIFISACTQIPKDTENSNSPDSNIETNSQNTETSSETWKNTELKNINTGENFKISDFEGQKVVLETFAVWCPTCTKQQKEIKKLIDSGDDSIHISLNIDPNEDESLIKEHTTNNGFNWYYAISPAEMSQSLIDEFGTTIINAPSAPVIIICEDQSFRLLGRGVKSSEELQSELNKC